jgi:hypothetical protein
MHNTRTFFRPCISPQCPSTNAQTPEQSMSARFPPAPLQLSSSSRPTGEQCLKPVDDLEGPYPPGDLEALKQDRRWNAGRKGTTRAHRSSWSCRRR